MNDVLTKIIITAINSISDMAFNSSKSAYSALDNYIESDILKGVSDKMFICTMFIVAIILTYKIYKQRFYIKDYTLIQRIFKKKHLVYSSMFLVILCCLQHDILSFMFNYWNSIFNETQLIDIIRQSTDTVFIQGLAGSVIILMFSVVSLIIAISQIIEVIVLQLILIFTPIIIVANFFNNEISYKFMSSIVQGIASPLCQTFCMYFIAEGLLPFISSNMDMTPPIMRIILIFNCIYMGYIMPKRFMKSLFIKEEKTTTRLNMIKENIPVTCGIINN